MKKWIIAILGVLLFFISAFALGSSPSVSLVSPTNNATLTTINVTFICNAADDSGLANASLYYGKFADVIKEFREDGTFLNKTDDAQISADSPNTNYGNLTEINVDGQTPHAHGLIRFPNMFGIEDGQIPLGAEIVSASLSVECFNPGNVMKAYILKEGWNEEEATWNNRMTNVPWSNKGADGPISRDNSSITWDCTTTGRKTFDMTNFVQKWSNSESNYGVVITDTVSDGNDFYTSEHPTIGNRPLLRVRYKSVKNWDAKQVKNLTGTSGSASFQEALDDKSTYKWNCLVTNANGASSFASSDFILKINTITPPTPTVPNLKVAFIGDQGLKTSAIEVLQLIKNESADIVLHQGDFDYTDNPDAWDNQINSVLGAGFPYFASIGNHDVVAWSGYQKKLSERLARIPNASCTGDLGVQSACYYKGLFFFLTAPGITGTDHDIYIRNQLANDNSIWSVCSWHKNQRLMQVGGKTDETGWGVYEECRKGGGILATAHEHSYSRTHLMNSFENQSIASTSNTLVLEKGKSFVFVSGLGGESIRSQLLNGSWWAAIYTSNQSADYGALFCTFYIDGQPNKARCYFKDIQGRVPDQFELISAVEEGAGNVPPVVNAGPDQLKSDGNADGFEIFTLDGSASYDPDGSIVSYEWREGDVVLGNESVIAQALSVGSHLVMLTVTDNNGTSTNDSALMTVQPNQPPVVNAGPDQTLSDTDGDGVASVLLNGSLSYDPDGSIVSYEWREGDVVLGTSVLISINLSVSTHLITLWTADNGGAIRNDSTTISIEKKPNTFVSTLSVIGGYVQKTKKALDPSLVQLSDDIRATIGSASYTSFVFSNLGLPSNATINSFLIYVEHFESNKVKSSEIQWNVGTGWPNAPITWGTKSQIPVNTNDIITVWDITSFVTNATRVDDVELQIVNKNRQKSIYADHIYAVINYTFNYLSFP